MESLPKNPYIEFNHNVLHDVRKQFNLHQPGAMAEAISNFEEWIQKQNHIVKKDFSKHYLECSIIMAKGSLEKAKNNLDKLCTMKTLLPKFFSKHDAKNEIMDISTFIVPALSPLPTKDNYRVFMFKVVNTDITPVMFGDYYRYFSLVCEYLKAHDYVQGMVSVVDLREVNVLNFIMTLNIVDLRSLATIFIEGYGMRVQGIHIVTESKAVDALVAVIKQIFSEKIAGRVQTHRTMATVYDFVPQNLLAEDYGGPLKSSKAMYYELVDVLSTKENVDYFKDICQTGTNEDYRLKTKFNEEILGMPGSFRTLQVD